MNKEYYPLYIVIPAYIVGVILIGFINRHLYTVIMPIVGSSNWAMILSVLITVVLFAVLVSITLLAIMKGIKYEDKNKETIYPLELHNKYVQDIYDNRIKDVKRNSELASRKDFDYKDNKNK